MFTKRVLFYSPLSTSTTLDLKPCLSTEKMEPITSIVDKLKSFAKSGQNFITRRNKSRQNPIEILKRLQREAFADLMKLRDRQDKVEKILTYTKGSAFQEDGTNVRGGVDVMGICYLIDGLDQENVDAIERARLRTGVDSRITFETKVGQKHIFEAELMANQQIDVDSGDLLGSALSLSKVSYTANLTDWCSLVAIPKGARCRDMPISTGTLFQDKGLTKYSSYGPPLLHQDHGTAIGLTVKKSNVVACLTQFLCDLPGSFGHCFSTFGQIVYELPMNTKLSLYGLHHVPKRKQLANPLALAISPYFWRHRKHREESMVTTPQISGTNVKEMRPAGSLAVMLESELDESTKIRGWLEMRNDKPRHPQWLIGVSDLPEDGVGWGVSLGGTTQGPMSSDPFQIEAFLKFNVGKKSSLQPGFVYLMDGSNHIPALMLHSTWSF